LIAWFRTRDSPDSEVGQRLKRLVHRAIIASGVRPKALPQMSAAVLIPQ
jgi:hypothetical protein